MGRRMQRLRFRETPKRAKECQGKTRPPLHRDGAPRCVAEPCSRATRLRTVTGTVTVAQGEIVKRLAGWAALLAAPTLLASGYGMNFHDMPELDKPCAYPATISLTIGICAALYFALKRAKWL
jgi:hypothetical protein